MMFLHISALTGTDDLGPLVRVDGKGLRSANTRGAPTSTINPIQSSCIAEIVSSPAIPTPAKTKRQATMRKVTWN